MKLTLTESVNLCYHQHDVECNQKYDGSLPYSFHLKMVVAVIKRFSHIIPETLKEDIIVAGAGHDLIEDARLTYNDIEELFNVTVAELIFLCTDTRGRDRSQRHSDIFYATLNENRWAVLIKLCDVIANSTYSRVMGSDMFKKYQKDLSKLKTKLYREGEYEELWSELELILS